MEISVLSVAAHQSDGSTRPAASSAPRRRTDDKPTRGPDELPKNSKNVPTYRTKQQTPATAARQLDFVFASESIAERVRVRAMNDVADWGPSDHCRVVIEVESAK